MHNTKKHQVIIQECILESARDAAILMGLLNKNIEEEVYAEKTVNNNKFTVSKKELKNRAARLDIIYIDQIPIGSVVLVEISHKLYHMAGMYIKESYRGKNLKDKLNTAPETDPHQKPSIFLLENLIKDLLDQDYQMTLEVMNYNRGACELYETRFFTGDKNKTELGLELMTKDNILSYSKYRKKNIGKWHNIGEENQEKRWGIQWENVPDYKNTTRWSINRIYLLAAPGDSFLLSDKSKISKKRKVELFLHILFSRQWLAYLNYRLTNIITRRS